jgi:DNA polymerase I-like protein with 3'-5' exonuclease and polymerase domains
MTHAYPNIAQTPAGYSPYGEECRECFTVPPGKKLVGADASALEGCCLAGFMARYDNGEYILVVTAGRKEDGTDVHSVTKRAIEIDSRDDAKTWFYAYLYGAGDEKLGSILTKMRKPAANRKRGAQSRSTFVKNMPALGLLVDAVKKSAKARGGYIRGLDGRWLRVRSEHAALNTLLQSAGAVLMKRALVILDDLLQKEGYVPGVNYEFVANVHDEWQIECDEGIADNVGRLAVAAIREAGVSFAFRCPLSGEFRVGSSWAETH